MEEEATSRSAEIKHLLLTSGDYQKLVGFVVGSWMKAAGRLPTPLAPGATENEKQAHRKEYFRQRFGITSMEEAEALRDKTEKEVDRLCQKLAACEEATGVVTSDDKLFDALVKGIKLDNGIQRQMNCRN